MMVCVVLSPPSAPLFSALFIPAPPTPPPLTFLSYRFDSEELLPKYLRQSSEQESKALLGRPLESLPSLGRKPQARLAPSTDRATTSSARGSRMPETHLGLSLGKKMILLQAGGTILGNIFMCNLECTFYAQLRQK